MLVVLLLTAAGCSSPSNTATPASASANATTAKTGTIVINPQFDGTGDFSDGLAAVRIGDFETGKVDVVPTAYQVRKRL